jgi:hypothetical protein
MSLLCIQEVNSRNNWLFAYNVYVIPWIKLLYCVSKRWIQEGVGYLLTTFVIISWMKFLYCVSKKWIQETVGYLLTLFQSFFCITYQRGEFKIQLVTYLHFFIVPWLKFLYCASKRQTQETLGYLLTIFHNFSNEISALCIQKVN